MTGTNCDLFTHNQSRSYLNHLVSSSALYTRKPSAYIPPSMWATKFRNIQDIHITQYAHLYFQQSSHPSKNASSQQYTLLSLYTIHTPTHQTIHSPTDPSIHHLMHFTHSHILLLTYPSTHTHTHLYKYSPIIASVHPYTHLQYTHFPSYPCYTVVLTLSLSLSHIHNRTITLLPDR
jgi:hypothetical protein